MGRRHHLIFLGILLAIAVMLLVYINIPKEKVKRYADNPTKWIETKGSIKSIKIEEATAGAGYVDSIGQQYNDKEISTAFRYSGFFHGDFFEDAYKDENGNVLMRISKDMIPNDGIIEGFVIEKIKDGKPIVNVFVDEDWKKLLGKTHIRYGKNFENVKVFKFSEITKGIYMDSFEDASRFMEDYTIHFGGIIVGDVSDEKIDSGDEDITLMKFS